MKTLALLLALCLPLAAADVYVTTFEAEANPSTYTNFADSTDHACSGTESAKTTNANGVMQTDFTEINPVWWGVYLYFDSLPSATTSLAVSRNSASQESCRFEITPTGTVTAQVQTGSAVTSTATLTAGQWQLIEFKCDTTQAGGSDIAEVRLNTVVIATQSAGSSTRPTGQVRFTEISDATAATYYDDWYVSNSAYRGYSAGCGDVSGGAAKRKAMVVGD